MIVLFTDYGQGSPYTGMLHLKAAALGGSDPIDLWHDAPRFDPLAAGLLYSRLHAQIPPGAVVVLVVDPGVGSAQNSILCQVDRRWLVGPDNGIMDAIFSHSTPTDLYQITHQRDDPAVQPTFHGRDIYLPLAVAMERFGLSALLDLTASSDRHFWQQIARTIRLQPAELNERIPDFRLESVIYIDSFGNCMTGISASEATPELVVTVAGFGWHARCCRTFSELSPGEVGWIANSFGLVELVLNSESLADRFGIQCGMPVKLM